MESLTEEQKVAFRRDGYLKYGQVIDGAEVERLRAALERVKAEEEGANPPERPPEFAYGHARGSASDGQARQIHQYVNIWKVAPEFEAVLHNQRIASAAGALMHAARVRLWHDQVISKPPGDNAHFACHHDFYFWPLDRPTMVTCWLALDDAVAANGCMHVVPGSHRDPRYQPPDCDLDPAIGLEPAAGGPGAPGSLYDDIRTWTETRTKPVELKAGECMFHHCLNWHLTPHNTTDRQRRAFVMIFMPDGTRYKHSQSPNHCVTNYLHLADGAPMDGPQFPVCG